MSLPTGENRDLQFPLDRSLVPEKQTPDESIVNFPFSWQTTDNDERVTITLDVSLNEFIILSSAIDVGSDIAYGEDAILVWWIWVRAINTMALCDQIAACIANDSGVQSAITNYLNGVGGGGVSTGGSAGAGANTTIIYTQNGTNIMDGGTCSNDNMYAVAVKITELAFETVNQLYQVIDQAISPLELATEVADNAPAVATAVPATAGDWLVWVQDTAYDSWQVFDSPTRRTEVACDIFCIMVDNGCSLTFDDLFGYFANKTLTAIFNQTLEQVLLDMVDILLTDEVGWTSLAFLFSMLSLGAKVAGIRDVGGFLTTIAAYIDETNNNWTLECDPCATAIVWNTIRGTDNANGTWTSVFDDVGNQYTWVIALCVNDTVQQVNSAPNASIDIGNLISGSPTQSLTRVGINMCGAANSSNWNYNQPILATNTSHCGSTLVIRTNQQITIELSPQVTPC